MKGFAKSIVGYLSIPFALLVLSFTGLQTWNLLYEVSGDAVMASIGLILFEGGMLYWWFFFRKEADGLPQMALSLIGAVLGLLLVAGATALHLGAVDAMTLGEHTPARLITIAALLNLVLKFTVPLVSPDQFEEIMSNALQGSIMMKGYARAEAQTDEIAQMVADEIGLVLRNRTMTGISTRFALPENIERSKVIEGTATAVDAETKAIVNYIKGALVVGMTLTDTIDGVVRKFGIDEDEAVATVQRIWEKNKDAIMDVRKRRIDNDPANDAPLHEPVIFATAAQVSPAPARLERDDDGANFTNGNGTAA